MATWSSRWLLAPPFSAHTYTPGPPTAAVFNCSPCHQLSAAAAAAIWGRGLSPPINRPTWPGMGSPQSSQDEASLLHHRPKACLLLSSEALCQQRFQPGPQSGVQRQRHTDQTEGLSFACCDPLTMFVYRIPASPGCNRFSLPTSPLEGTFQTGTGDTQARKSLPALCDARATYPHSFREQLRR